MKSIFTLIFGLMVCTTALANTFTVAATNFKFSPVTLSVNTGDIVHWIFDGTHDVTSGGSCASDGKFSSGTKTTGDTYDFTFTNAGSFPYFCSFHCSAGMTGMIIVSEASSIDENNISAALLKCYPNPFSGKTTLSYSLQSNAEVRISVIDMTGRKVLETIKNQAPGNQSEQLDMNVLPAGMYILNVNLVGIESKSMVLVKQ